MLKHYSVVVEVHEDVPQKETWFFNGEEVNCPIYTYEKEDTALLNLLSYNENRSRVVDIQPIEYDSAAGTQTDEISVETQYENGAVSYKIETIRITIHLPKLVEYFDIKGNKVNLETKG